MDFTKVVLVLVHLAVMEAVDPTPPDGFEHSIWMDSMERYRLYWKFDSETITFEVHVQTLGWVGFGLSPTGTMAGGDIVTIAVQTDGRVEFLDRHGGTFNGLPPVDDDQNWTLLAHSQTDTHTVSRFTRYRTSCDTDDMNISEETVRLIYAYSGSRTVQYHGYETRGTKSVQLLKVMPTAGNIPSNAVAHDFDMQRHNIPADRTSYFCQLLRAPQLQGRQHVVAFETRLTPGNEGTVHHMTLYGCFDDPMVRIGRPIGSQWNCYDQATNMPAMDCTTAIFGWAIGSEIFYFPDNTGFPIGGNRQPSYMFLEIHYDNPSRRSNMWDYSGMRLWITPTLRQYDTGVMQIGSAIGPDFQVVPPKQQTWTSQGHCSASCLREAIYGGNKDRINIYAHLLHTHGTGKKVSIHHYRGTSEMKPIANDLNYDYNFQEIRLMKSESVLYPGDSLMVDCDYNTANKFNVIEGGMTTENEMCYAFLLYYPAVDLTWCLSYPTPKQMLDGIPGMGNVEEGYQPDNSPVPEPEGRPEGQPQQQQAQQPQPQPMLGHSMNDHYNIVTGRYRGMTMQQVLRQQNWMDQNVKRTFQRAVLEGQMGGFCIYENRNYAANGLVENVPLLYSSYTEQQPQCQFGAPTTTTTTTTTPRPTTTTVSDPSCQDMNSALCTGWQPYCAGYAEVRSYCRKTCGECQPQNQEPQHPCEDLDANCRYYQNSCQLSDYIKNLCPRTCNFCGSSECVNDARYDRYCHLWTSWCDQANVIIPCPRTCQKGCGGRLP